MEGLTAGTLILTGYGLTPVETINEGDIIVRPDGTFTTVTRAGHMPSDTISLYGQGHTGFTCTPGILFTDMEDDTPRPACHMKDRRWTIGMPRMEDNPDTRLTDTEAWALGWLAGSGFTINDGFYLPASSQPDGETVERFRAANLTEHYPGCWGTEQDVNRIWDAYHPLNETGHDRRRHVHGRAPPHGTARQSPPRTAQRVRALPRQCHLPLQRVEIGITRP